MRIIFFDADEDGTPELGIWETEYIYIFKYDSEVNDYSLWCALENTWYHLAGSRKVMWPWDGKYMSFWQLDQNGEMECETFFGSNWFSDEVSIHLVMLPQYADEQKETIVTEEMKKCGIYARSDGQWYFRVTEEQYNKLEEVYFEAYDLAREKIKEVTYTYEELFEYNPKTISDTESELSTKEHYNTYFFQNAATYQFNGRFSALSVPSEEKEVDLIVTEIHGFKEGILYELKINVNANKEIHDRYRLDRYSMDRLNLGYFFVQEDKIYLIREEAVRVEQMTAEELVSHGTLVCQEEEKADALGTDEQGWHEYISVDGNRREYHGYNDLVETGFYEHFTWEMGKGLVAYKSGYGAETDDIELYLIDTDNKEILNQVNSIDFTVKQSVIKVTEKEDVQYREAYFKVLQNEIPIIDEAGEEIYYRDLWRAGIDVATLWDNKSETDFPYEIYYKDLDGDKKPELAINQGCFYIFKYDLEEKLCRILYSEQSCYFGGILGEGQLWYHDGLHANVVRDRYILFDGQNEWETVLDLEEGVRQSSEFSDYFRVGTVEAESVMVDEDTWKPITEPFFEMTENLMEPQCYEEVFGDIYEGTEQEFDRIISGNFNNVYDLNTNQIDELKHVYDVHNDDSCWLHMDVNVDGIDELVWCEKREEYNVVLAIFAIQEKGCKRVFWDIIDSGEFHMVINNKIAYYWQYLGTYEHYCFCVTKFDKEFNRNYERYEIIKITDAEEVRAIFEECKEGTYYIRAIDSDQKKEVSYEEWIIGLKNAIGEVDLKGFSEMQKFIY